MRRNPYFIAGVFFALFCVVFGSAWASISIATGTNQWSERFSLGQLMVEFCLVPVAITGFVVTIAELRKAQQRASLDIFWITDDGKLSKTFTVEYPRSANFITVPIALTNDGNSPSMHYQVNLEYPLSYGRAQMRSRDWTHASHQFHKFIFRSAPQYISFPEDHVELDKMEFLEPSKLPETIEIRYRIFSDTSEYKEGRLTIRFEKAG